VANIFRVLERDHGEVGRLLAQLQADSPAPTMDEAGRIHLVEHLVISESRHEAAEEMVFWPAVRKRVRGGDELADKALAQEREGKYILDALRVAATNASRSELVEDFARSARAHVAFEEEQVWPALRHATTHVAWWTMGLRFSFASKFGPTRPHPRGPDRPVGLLTRGMVAATLDHARDRMARRHA
jgi:hypothetical protein